MSGLEIGSIEVAMGLYHLWRVYQDEKKGEKKKILDSHAKSMFRFR